MEHAVSQDAIDIRESASQTDPTPELPPAIPGLVTPHAMLHQLNWRQGWPERITAEHAVVPDEAEEELELNPDEYDGGPTGPNLAITGEHLELTEIVDDEDDPVELADDELETLDDGDLRLADSAPSSATDEATPGALKSRGTPPPALPRRAKRARPSRRTGSEDAVDSLMTELLDDDPAPTGPRRTREWWSEIFDESYLQLVPGSTRSRTSREVAFLIGSLAPVEGARLLDVGCGVGRHALELAERGMNVVGVDRSRVFLERALTAADERGLEVEFLLGDMREMSFELEFDGVYCIETTFGYFDDATNFDVLKRMVSALKPGARLLIDQVNRDHVVSQVPRRSWWETGDMVVMDDVRFDHATSRLLIERSLVEGGGDPWEQHISIRLYAPHEMCTMMRALGLEVLGISGDIATPGRYFGMENRCNIVTARKPFVAE